MRETRPPSGEVGSPTMLQIGHELESTQSLMVPLTDHLIDSLVQMQRAGLAQERGSLTYAHHGYVPTRAP